MNLLADARREVRVDTAKILPREINLIRGQRYLAPRRQSVNHHREPVDALNSRDIGVIAERKVQNIRDRRAGWVHEPCAD